MNIKIKRNRIISYFFYKTLLDFIYIFWINPIYGYIGFDMEFSIIRYIVSSIMLFILVIFTPSYKNRISELVFQLHLIVMFVPLLTIYVFNNTSLIFLAAMIFIFLLQIIVIKLLPLVHFRSVKGGKILVWFFIILVTSISYLFLMTTQNLNIKALDLISVYEIREERIIQPIIMNYILTWQFRFINPILLIYSLKKKKALMLSSIILLQLLFFLYYPNKEILFSFGLIFIAYYISHKKLIFEKVFIIFISIIAFATILVNYLFNHLVLFANFVWRLLYVPAIIKFWHYDFFSKNPKLYYSEGIIGRIFDIQSPYQVTSGFLIGRMGNANTGYIAYGYDNAGFFGMLLISIVMILVLYFIDSITSQTNHKIVFPLLIYPMLTLNDTDLLTLLLTGGLFIFFVFSIFNKSFFIESKYKDIDDETVK